MRRISGQSGEGLLRRKAILLAGTLAAAWLMVPAASAVSSGQEATAVVALVDTGINPYHQVFRDRSARADQYPGSYLPGFPNGAIALHITPVATDYYTAPRNAWQRTWT